MAIGKVHNERDIRRIESWDYTMQAMKPNAIQRLYDVENVLILESGLRGIFGRTLRINATKESRLRKNFQDCCKAHNAALAAHEQQEYLITPKKEDDHSFTVEFSGRFISKNESIEIANAFAELLRVPLIII